MGGIQVFHFEQIDFLGAGQLQNGRDAREGDNAPGFLPTRRNGQ
jgi:hypothetical protein